jgi:hypothetical protein
MYLEPTDASVGHLLERNIAGPIVMLNLLRLRANADYSATPGLAPVEPISGHEAYRKYVDHTKPFLAASGGQLLLEATGGHNFIGPLEERWDVVMLVQQASLADFFAFASNDGYLAGMGHRTAAVEDSRLIPLVPFGID